MKKLVVLASRSPLPLQKGDKLRLYHQIKFLAEHFSIYLIALQEKAISHVEQTELESLCEEVHLYTLSRWQSLQQVVKGWLKGSPLTVNYFYNASIDHKIRTTIHNIQPDHIYCQLIRMAPYVEGIQIRKSIDYMDAFSLRAQRLVAKKKGPAKLLWRREEKLLNQYERQVHRWFYQHFIISEVDRQHLSIAGRSAPTLLQNGVDARYFHRTAFSPPEVRTLVLVGNMSYHPNVMAAKYLVREIGPKLWQQDSNIKIVIAGAEPRRSVLALSGDRVEVRGFVEDIRSVYALGSVFVAPIFTGSGLQNKILEALAMECPCVTTSIVQDSIPYSDDIVSVADTSDEFVVSIMRLLSSHQERANVASKGRDMVLKHYSWEQACLPLLALL